MGKSNLPAGSARAQQVNFLRFLVIKLDLFAEVNLAYFDRAIKEVLYRSSRDR